MSSFLCFVCHSTVNADTNEETREKYREVIGMNLCPDSHLCYICCYFLNKMWMFKSICLKRSLEYPVLFSEKGTINLHRSETFVSNLCSEDTCIQHLNTRFHFHNNNDNSQSDFDDNNYCELQDDRNFDINDTLLKTAPIVNFRSEDYLFVTKDNIEDSLFHEQLMLPNLEPVRVTQNDLVNGEWMQNIPKISNKNTLLELNCRNDGSLEGLVVPIVSSETITIHNRSNINNIPLVMGIDQDIPIECNQNLQEVITGLNYTDNYVQVENCANENIENSLFENVQVNNINVASNINGVSILDDNASSINDSVPNINYNGTNVNEKLSHLNHNHISSINVNVVNMLNDNKTNPKTHETNVYDNDTNPNGTKTKLNDHRINPKESVPNVYDSETVQNENGLNDSENNNLYDDETNSNDNKTNINDNETILNDNETNLNDNENKLNENKVETSNNGFLSEENSSDGHNNSNFEQSHKLIENKPKKHKKKKLYEKITLTLEEQKTELEKGRKDEKYMTASYKCHSCAMYFYFKDTYQTHMMRHEESNGEHFCSLCSLRFADPTVLRLHVANHCIRYKCRLCGDAVRARQRPTHARYCAGERDSKYCNSCDKEFQGRQHYQQHLRRYHGSNLRCYLCNVCGKSYDSRPHLRTHIITHINRKFDCDQCTSTFSSPYTLNQHKKSKHVTKEPEIHHCATCKLTYNSRKSLLAHMRNALAHKESVYKCSVCGRPCPSHAALERHNKAVHIRPRHLCCRLCQKRYSTTKALVRHMASHKEGRPVPLCHACGATFKSITVLNRHLKNVCEKETRKCPTMEEELLQGTFFD